jgi:hypothetical protein
MSVRATVFLAMLFLAACDRSKSPPQAGVANADSGPAPRRVGSTAIVWDAGIGPIVATPSVETGAPTLFVRDTAGTADIEVELFSHDAQTLRASLRPGGRIHACPWERGAALSQADSQPSPPVWSLALAPGIATPVGIDGVGDMLPRDSAALVARISRSVSALPDDSLSQPFRGLPIVIRDAWRMQFAGDTSIVVAVATRTLNVESNPRTEAVTIILEPDPANPATAWRTGFSRRDAGPEDRVEGADLLAALRLKGGTAAVALVRESENGLQVEIVERMAPGVWRIRWSSAALSCQP